MRDHPRIQAARDKADAARARLRSTVYEAKARLSPGAMADRAVEDLKDRALTAVASGVAGARKRPVVLGAIVGLGALLASQRPVRRLLGRFMQPKAATTVSKAKPGNRPRSRKIP